MTVTTAQTTHSRRRVGRTLRRLPVLGAAFLTLSLSGCSVINNMIYKTSGDVLQGFAKSHTVPYMMTSGDLEMSCAMSEATAPLLMSFGRVTDSPEQLAVVLGLSAGSCEERRAWEAELDYMRALREQRPSAAQDALIRQKRHAMNAATRFYDGWKSLERHYGTPGSGQCPSFSNDLDEFIYMAGLLSGLQALNSEIQATATVGVPKNIGALVERSSGCLDDNKWWGAPIALRAVVWAMIPGAEPKGENAFQRLAASDVKGEQAGVRLSHVMHALAAYNKGDMDLLRDILRKHARVTAEKPANPEWVMVDRMATLNLMAISDRLWTENTGHRTPIGGLGTFWDDKKAPAAEAVDLDGIF